LIVTNDLTVDVEIHETLSVGILCMCMCPNIHFNDAADFMFRPTVFILYTRLTGIVHTSKLIIL